MLTAFSATMAFCVIGSMCSRPMTGAAYVTIAVRVLIQIVFERNTDFAKFIRSSFQENVHRRAESGEEEGVDRIQAVKAGLGMFAGIVAEGNHEHEPQGEEMEDAPDGMSIRRAAAVASRARHLGANREEMRDEDQEPAHDHAEQGARDDHRHEHAPIQIRLVIL